MNLLLFESHQVGNDGSLTVSGRQHLHLQQTLRVQPGQVVRVGELNGLMGDGTVVEINDNSTRLSLDMGKQPPAALPLILVLALPRPKMMRRVLQTVASMGVKEIHLINSFRVDKSYWRSPRLDPCAVREQLILGLEQAGDTRLPEIRMHKLFKPFVEDHLADVVSGTTAVVAHPYTEAPCPTGLAGPVSLAIGPEGGFIPYEVEKLEECGFQAVTLGQRILRVETAIPVLITKLMA